MQLYQVSILFHPLFWQRSTILTRVSKVLLIVEGRLHQMRKEQVHQVKQLF